MRGEHVVNYYHVQIIWVLYNVNYRNGVEDLSWLHILASFIGGPRIYQIGMRQIYFYQRPEKSLLSIKFGPKGEGRSLERFISLKPITWEYVHPIAYRYACPTILTISRPLYHLTSFSKTKCRRRDGRRAPLEDLQPLGCLVSSRTVYS